MRRWLKVAGSALLLAGGPARAANNDNFTLCYSPAFAGWRNFLEPCIDGIIDGANNTPGGGNPNPVNCGLENDGTPRAGKPEQGWANSFRYVFNRGVVDNNNVPVNDVVMLGLANVAPDGTQHLDLGVQVHNDKTFDDEDLVVFAFEFSSTSYGLISINPITRAGGAVVPANPSLVKYYTATSVDGTGRPQWGPATNAPTFVTYAAHSDGDTNCKNGVITQQCLTTGQGCNCNWDVEVQVKLGSGGMPPPVRSYFGVSRVYHVGTSVTDTAAEEFAWPPTNPNGDDPLLYDSPTFAPPAPDWGLAVVNSTAGCHGASFGPADLSATPSPKVGVTSTLQVNVHNSSIDGTSGAAIPARGVQAQFLHAPFGSASFGSFQSIGQSAPVDVPASSGGTPITVPWTPTTASPHECILCRLSSTVNGTTFINAGEFFNSAVAANPTEVVNPRISMKGVAPRKGGGPQKVRVATQSRLQYAYADGGLADIPAATLTAQLNRTFFVSRDTGRTITILRNPIPVLEPLPSYVITFQHPLDATFQTPFEQRHADLFTRVCRLREIVATDCLGGIKARILRGDKRLVQLVNGLLAGDAEKPQLDDFHVSVQGLSAVPDTGGAILQADIENEGELVVPTSSTYAAGTGTGTCNNCFCGCLQTKKAPAALLISFSLLAVVGVFAHRRRR